MMDDEFSEKNTSEEGRETGDEARKETNKGRKSYKQACTNRMRYLKRRTRGVMTSENLEYLFR